MGKSKIELEFHDDVLHPSLASHALAVGALCHASLEITMRMMFLAVSGMPRDSTSFAIAHTFDFSDILMANKVAFVENCQDTSVIGEALSCLNYIDNILRPRRNRFVHDLWNFDENSERAERFDFSVKIQKAQSHKPLSTTMVQIHPMEIDELWTTVKEVREHGALLHTLQLAFSDLDNARERLRKSPPQRRFLPSPRGKRDPSGSDEQVPSPPPESFAT